MIKTEKIISRNNRRLVHARRVRDGKIPTQIFIEGRRLVEEALRSQIEIDECFIVEGFRAKELIATISARVVPMIEVSTRSFASIADTDQSQGIIVIAKRQQSRLEDIEFRLNSSSLPLVIFLKEINNPSNLGAILRTAEAAGVAGIIVSTNSADAFSPKALRSAMGSSFHLTVCENISFDGVLAWAIERNLVTTAADIAADETYTSLDWKKPRLLVFGSEAHGLTENELERVEQPVRIPMDNSVESLNIAVSSGIILFEAKRQNSSR